jgi:hypothetical protein
MEPTEADTQSSPIRFTFRQVLSMWRPLERQPHAVAATAYVERAVRPHTVLDTRGSSTRPWISHSLYNL